MEEKRYPNIEEESNTHMACESAAAVTSVASPSVDGITAVHDWIDDLNWDKYPVVGPASEAEAIESIDQFEENSFRESVFQRRLIGKAFKEFAEEGWIRKVHLV